MRSIERNQLRVGGLQVNEELVLDMYGKGIGSATISMKLKINHARVIKFLKERGVLRSRKEGYAARAAHNREEIKNVKSRLEK